MTKGNGREDESHARRVVEIFLEDVGEVVAESLCPSQYLGVKLKQKRTYINARPLVHHVRAHAEKDTMQVSSLGGIAEDFTPGGLLLAALGLNSIENLL